jgi:hypothetical protein
VERLQNRALLIRLVDDGTGRIRVIPEIDGIALLFELSDNLLTCRDVKDTPASRPSALSDYPSEV